VPQQLVDELPHQLHADWLTGPLGSLQYDGGQPVDTGRELLHESSLLPLRHMSREASRKCTLQQRLGMHRQRAVFLASPL
jgi:hypothetical protein